MFKNTASQKLTVFCFDSTTNLPKTGDAANLTAYRDIDDGGVTVLTDTSATEKDATNAKGYYIFDLTQAETNGDKILFSCKSSTANIVCIAVPAVVYTLPATGILAPATAGRTLVVDASGLADANMVKAGPSGSGTAQTAGDLYSKVSGLTYTVANQVDANVKSNAGTAITSASGIQEVKVASLAAAALTSIAAAVWDALTSGMSTVGSIGKKLADWVVGTIDTYTGNTKQTGDVYARLGAPAGASVSADIAAVKSETAAILDDTGTSGVVVAAASKTGYRLSATGVDDILDEVVQGTATVRQLLGWMGASTQGVSSGYGTGTVTFYYNDGTTAALIVTISGGNRTAITRA